MPPKKRVLKEKELEDDSTFKENKSYKREKEERDDDDDENDDGPQEKKPRFTKKSKEKTDGIPHFDEDDLIKGFGRNSYLKGVEYFSQGAVSDLTNQANPPSLGATCKGSRPSDKYVLSAHFTEDDSEDLFLELQCTCPVGTETDGKCKHVVAMLLTWMHLQFIYASD